MEQGKVVYLDDYRRTKQFRQKTLLALIEGHLAEAGLLEEFSSVSHYNREDGCLAPDECWQPWDADEAGEESMTMTEITVDGARD